MSTSKGQSLLGKEGNGPESGPTEEIPPVTVCVLVYFNKKSEANIVQCKNVSNQVVCTDIGETILYRCML